MKTQKSSFPVRKYFNHVIFVLVYLTRYKLNADNNVLKKNRLTFNDEAANMCIKWTLKSKPLALRSLNIVFVFERERGCGTRRTHARSSHHPGTCRWLWVRRREMASRGAGRTEVKLVWRGKRARASVRPRRSLKRTVIRERDPGASSSKYSPQYVRHVGRISPL